MKHNFATSLLCLAATCGVLGARPARAADASCVAIAVDVDAGVRGLWPGVAQQIRTAFDARDDIDACAWVRLSTEDRGVRIEVTLPDGRFASRGVARRDDVLPTLEALLLVPQRRPPATPIASRSPEPPRASAVLPATPERDAATPAPARASHRVLIELSAVTGGRIGDGQISLGVGAVSFLDISGWLVGFGGRLDGYQGPPSAALEFAVPVGRRFRFGNQALDLTAGPALALHGGGDASTQPSSVPATDTSTESTPGILPRALVGARLNFRSRSVFRTFVGVDGDFGAATPPGSHAPTGSARMPIWTAGLAFGATVGTL
jgi:hypothetical protein